MKAQYPDLKTYTALVEALVTAEMDQFDRQNAIKLALAEIGNIWPASMKPAVRVKAICSPA